MSVSSDLFVDQKFRQTIIRFCEFHDEINVEFRNEDCAELSFDTPWSDAVEFLITRHGAEDSLVSFSAEIETNYQVSDAPHPLSTLLLMRNAQQRIGMWRINLQYDNTLSYECTRSDMHVRSLDWSTFQEVVIGLINECVVFFEAMA